MNDRRSSGSLRRVAVLGRAALGLAAVIAAFVAPDARAGADGDAGIDGPGDGKDALRVQSDPGRSVALEVSAQTFERKEGAGPAVTLVGVVHIGDRDYYRDVQKLLEDYDLVLYESVKPSGTGGATTMGEDATNDERIKQTKASLDFVASVVELHRQRLDRYPSDLDAVRGFAASEGPRLAEFVESAMLDAWGRAVVYSAELLPPLDAVKPAPKSYRLWSRGADGRDGGEGVDADIAVDSSSGIVPLARAGEDNIQAQLAQALNLAFQLDAIDYDHENWRCSDMSIDQIQSEMAARGADFTLVEGTLAGTSLPAKLAKLVLGIVRFADMFVEGAISDTFKVLLIEMLSDESLIESSLGQFDAAFAEVIIGERNQVVVDDVRRLVEAGEAGDADMAPGSVAILYGAGHVPDLAERLMDQLGYRPTDARWLRAIEVDLTTSAVSESDVRRLRRTVKQAMRRMASDERFTR